MTTFSDVRIILLHYILFDSHILLLMRSNLYLLNKIVMMER